MNIKSKSLTAIENNNSYYGCTFFLPENTKYKIEDCFFENCSFRTDVVFKKIENCHFINCNFSNKFELDLSKTVLPKEIEQLSLISLLI